MTHWYVYTPCTCENTHTHTHTHPEPSSNTHTHEDKGCTAQREGTVSLSQGGRLLCSFLPILLLNHAAVELTCSSTLTRFPSGCLSFHLEYHRSWARSLLISVTSQSRVSEPQLRGPSKSKTSTWPFFNANHAWTRGIVST